MELMLPKKQILCEKVRVKRGVRSVWSKYYQGELEGK